MYIPMHICELCFLPVHIQCIMCLILYLSLLSMQLSSNQPAHTMLENPESETRWYFKYFLGKGTPPLKCILAAF